MKELFNKHAKHSTGVSAWKPEMPLMDEAGFIDAIDDYKQSTIGIIDEMIEKESPYWRLGVAKIATLRELKQKIEEL